MENVAVVWDESPFAEHIDNETGREVSVITSRDSLDHRLSQGTLDETSLVVLLELTWEGNRRSEFYGLEVVRELIGEEKFEQPIVFCSFADQQSLYEVEGVSGELARMPFPFERLPASPDQLVARAKDAEPRSEMWLAFVRRIALEKPLLMRAHDIDQAVPKPGKDMVAAARRALDDLDDLNLDLPGRLSEKRRSVEKALRRAENELNEDGGEVEEELREAAEAREELREFAVFLRGVNTSRGEETRKLAKNERKRNIILVEDQEDQLNYYREGLRRHFNVFATQRADEALSELEENPDEYQAIIADWILFDPSGEMRRWQDLQGFELLEQAGRYGPICRVALTSSSRPVLSAVKNAASSTLYDAYFPKRSLGRTEEGSFQNISVKVNNIVNNKERVKNRIPIKGEWKGEGKYRKEFLNMWRLNSWEEIKEEIKKDAQKISKEYVKYRNKKRKDEIRWEAIPDMSGGNLDYKYKWTDNVKGLREEVKNILKTRLLMFYLHFGEGETIYKVTQLVMGYSGISGRPAQLYQDLGIHYTKEGFLKKKILPYEVKWFEEIFGRWLIISEEESVVYIIKEIFNVFERKEIEIAWRGKGNSNIEDKRNPESVIKIMNDLYWYSKNEGMKDKLKKIKEVYRRVEGEYISGVGDKAENEFRKVLGVTSGFKE